MGAIWKYNAGVHFAKYHPTAIPTEHLNNITISKSERAALQLRWEKRHSTRKRQPKENRMPLLVIAEQHTSSRLAIS